MLECDICKVSKDNFGQPVKVKEAKFAVKEDTLLLLCENCMEYLYGMHETTLLVGDTYIPQENESDDIMAVVP